MTEAQKRRLEANAKYWATRQTALQERLLNKGDDFYRALSKEFDRAAVNIENEIRAFYSRFASENKISYAEAQKILTSDERERFRMTIDEYLEKGRTLNYSKAHEKALKNASTVYRVSRLQALQLQMRQHAEVLTIAYNEGMQKTAESVYLEGYYRRVYELNKGIGFGVNFATLDSEKVRDIVAKPWAADGRDFSSRIWGNRAELVNRSETDMAQAFIRGDSPQKLIREIHDKLGASKRNAARLVQTESAYFASRATMDAYKSQEVEKYQILATLDTRTSEVCQTLDGMVMESKDYEPGRTAPPFHCNCRTTTVPYFEPDDLDAGHERAARDERGEYYTVPAGMKYEEWHKKHVESNPKAVLAEKKDTNRYSDAKLFEKYKAVFGKDLPKTLDEFQNMKYTDSVAWERLKGQKQERLNSMDYRASFDGKFSNVEVRSWYIVHDKNITSLLDPNATLEQRARHAHQLRNMYKKQARDMMSELSKRKEIDRNYPIQPFEYYYAKYKNAHNTDDDAYAAIVDSAARSNKTVNRVLGVD